MSDPEHLDHEAGARFMEKLLAEDPAKLDVATDEQVDAMMAAEGIEVGSPESAEAALARGEKRARDRQARAAAPARDKAREASKRSAGRRAWAAGALVTAAAAAVVAVEVSQSVQGPGAAIGPDHPGPGVTPEAQAKWLRTDALAACAVGDFDKCRTKLDEARGLDPAGESDPKVVEARKAIAMQELSPGPFVPVGPKEQGGGK
jgi:hypothetical protein